MLVVKIGPAAGVAMPEVVVDVDRIVEALAPSQTRVGDDLRSWNW